MPALFASVLFLNALLLFWVQPLFAKIVLPLLGGSPSVWTTCMLFFQAALLAGYAYGHAGIRLLGIRRHALLHGILVWVPLLFLPIDVNLVSSAAASDAPVGWLLRVMGASIGFPFVVLASTAPLLQRWFSSADTRSSADPYWLYAASNAGSLIALLAFPIVFEPLIPLGSQQAIWKIGYGIVATLLAACAIVTYRRSGPAEAGHYETALAPLPLAPLPPAPLWSDRARWLALSFAPSSLMLGVTTYLSTDVAAVPLLWVVPLACYLLTFIVAFGWYSDGVRARAQRMLPHVLLPLVLLLLSESSLPLVLAVLVHVGAFTLISLLCHGQLALQRPGINHLTEFYLWLAAGGVLGGIFNTLIAPQVFTSVAEYPIAIVAGCLLCVSRGQVLDALANPRSLRRPAFAMAMAVALVIGGRMGGIAGPPILALLGAPALVCLSVAKDAARFALGITGLFAAFAIGNALVPSGDGQVLRAERTFFGVYRVKADPNRPLISLLHGTTIHGRQVIGDASPEPSTYYHRQSPIGQVLTARGDRARSIGVIGLGTGTLAAYVTPGAHWVFYEIDGAVERLARDARFFRYLERCGTQCDVVIGDARLTLARSQAAHDILILDAFSSDAIPVHLLTTEAVQTYEARLAESGVLAFHISNRHIQLRPVLGRLARARGLVAFARFDAAVDTQRGHAASDWVIMARRAETLSDLTHDARWTRLSADHRRAWSDDFSNIWSELQ